MNGPRGIDHGAPLLAATLHDPDQRFLPLIRQVGQRLRWYADVAIVATTSSDKETISALIDLGVTVSGIEPGAAGEARRMALRLALKSESPSILSCDFDRWLHWASTFPDELADISGRVTAIRPSPRYVCIGRTPRAFATHPRVQQEAECATNHALELALGFPVDATAGASWLSREAAEYIVARSLELSSATDLEWPALIHVAHKNGVSCIATDGLEFETATFFPEEVASVGGRENWIRKQYERPETWRDRLWLAAESVSALTRILTE